MTARTGLRKNKAQEQRAVSLCGRKEAFAPTVQSQRLLEAAGLGKDPQKKGIYLSILYDLPPTVVLPLAHRENKIPAQLLTCPKECRMRGNICPPPYSFLSSSPQNVLIIPKQIFNVET